MAYYVVGSRSAIAHARDRVEHRENASTGATPSGPVSDMKRDKKHGDHHRFLATAETMAGSEQRLRTGLTRLAKR